jgi:hypothetical protein
MSQLLYFASIRIDSKEPFFYTWRASGRFTEGYC